MGPMSPVRSASTLHASAAAAVRPGRAVLALCLALSCTVACGRVGVELEPVFTETESGVGVADASTAEDVSSRPIACEGCSNAHGSAACVDGTCIIDCDT